MPPSQGTSVHAPINLNNVIDELGGARASRSSKDDLLEEPECRAMLKVEEKNLKSSSTSLPKFQEKKSADEHKGDKKDVPMMEKPKE